MAKLTARISHQFPSKIEIAQPSGVALVSHTNNYTSIRLRLMYNFDDACNLPVVSRILISVCLMAGDERQCSV